METRRIRREDPDYPPALKGASGLAAPEFIGIFGNAAILQKKMLGLLCSVKCPGDLVLKTYDSARAIRDAGLTTISGFHSPMEAECLHILLRGTQSIVVCPARDITTMRLPPTWRTPLDEGRLLVLSPFDARARRMTRDTSCRRNLFAAAMADDLLVPYATPGGEVEDICRQAMAIGKQVYTLDADAGRHLIRLGAQPFDLPQTT